MNATDEPWNYFQKDPGYSDVLKHRLAEGVEMDSAKAMGHYLNDLCRGDLKILDFGGGPGHYFPVIRSSYKHGSIGYTSVDIDAGNVAYGKEFFRNQPDVSLKVGSVLQPRQSLEGQNCIISANTLPHVPSIEPLLEMLSETEGIHYFVFRMLVGEECVQIKKHLSGADFEGIFDRNFQFNNIYSKSYIEHHLGRRWQVRIESDIFDLGRLSEHRIPEQDNDPFYANRVSRPVQGMIFKGDVYMPWRFVLGARVPGA